MGSENAIRSGFFYGVMSMSRKRAASRGKVMVKVESVGKQEITKATIDRFYVHCRYCGFFLERGLGDDPDEDVCSGRLCSQKKEMDRELTGH